MSVTSVSMVYFTLLLNFILFFLEIKGGGGVYCRKALYCEHYFFNGTKISPKGDSRLTSFALVRIYIYNYGNVG